MDIKTATAAAITKSPVKWSNGEYIIKALRKRFSQKWIYELELYHVPSNSVVVVPMKEVEIAE